MLRCWMLKSEVKLQIIGDKFRAKIANSHITNLWPNMSKKYYQNDKYVTLGKFFRRECSVKIWDSDDNTKI